MFFHNLSFRKRKLNQRKSSSITFLLEKESLTKEKEFVLAEETPLLSKKVYSQ